MVILRGTESDTKKTEFTLDDQLDYVFYDEVSLLTVFILLQLSKENITSVPFETFFQYPFDKKEAILEEMHDYENMADYIYNQCFNHCLSNNDLIDFFTINKIIIDSESILDEILEKFGKNIIADGVEVAKDIASYYSYVIGSFFALKEKCGFKKEYINNKFKSEFSVEPMEFRQYSNELLDSAPKSIALNFVFKKDVASLAEKQIDKYLIANYEKENLIHFYDYISNLKFTNGNLKIPFDGIAEAEFNIVETLKYLELTKHLEIQSWIGRNHHWEVRLLSNEMLAIFIPNIDLLVQKKDSIPNALEVRFTEDGNLEYEAKPSIFDLTPLQKVLCKKLYSKKVNYNFDTLEIEEAVYGDEGTKQSQEKLKKLIERMNRKIRDEFGIQEWIHYGANSLRRLV